MAPWDMIQPFETDKTILDDEALVWRFGRDELDRDEADGASAVVGGRATRSIAIRAFHGMFGHSAWQSKQRHHSIKKDHHCGVDANASGPSASLAIDPGLERGAVRYSSIFIKPWGEDLHTPTLADTEDSLVAFDAHTQAERALIRHVALAAAVTTWCILQPFILFFVIAHFKQYVQALADQSYSLQLTLPLI